MKKIISFVFMVVMIPCLAGVVVMLLWNVLMPGLFGWVSITFWQALGLFLLSHVLWGGLGLGLLFMGGLAHTVFHGRGIGRAHGHWERMSADERRKFIERLEERRRKYGAGYPFGRNNTDSEGNETEAQDS